MEQLVILLEADTPDHNGVVYPKEVLARAIEQFQERLDDNNEMIPGECSIPDKERDFGSIDLDRVSHVVKSIWFDGNVVKGKIKLIGKYAELAAEGLEFAVIPRAVGTVAEGVCSLYTLVTLDLAYSEN